jgi:hypothetical protein
MDSNLIENSLIVKKSTTKQFSPLSIDGSGGTGMYGWRYGRGVVGLWWWHFKQGGAVAGV